MQRQIRIGNSSISDHTDCFVIADIDSCHCGSIDLCINALEIARQSGADAVNIDPLLFDPRLGEFSLAGFTELVVCAQERRLELLSPMNGLNRARLLAKLPVAACYIDFGDLHNSPLLKLAASLDLPVILNTGASDLADIHRAQREISATESELAILHSHAAFRPHDSEINLRAISSLREEFPESVVGLSLREASSTIAVGALTLGARIVEAPLFSSLDTEMDPNSSASRFQEMALDLRRVRLAL